MQKPKVKLTGLDSNTMVLLAACTRALKRAGQSAEADALVGLVFNSGTQDEAISHMAEFCEVS